MKQLWDSETVERIAERIKAQRLRDEAGLARRVEQAHVEARRIALQFAEECSPPVRRVFLFGSLAEDRVRSLSFDIDLAAEGGDLLRCILIAEKSEFHVDVVALESLPEAMRAGVESHGVVLYEAAADGAVGR